MSINPDQKKYIEFRKTLYSEAKLNPESYYERRIHLQQKLTEFFRAAHFFGDMKDMLELGILPDSQGCIQQILFDMSGNAIEPHFPMSLSNKIAVQVMEGITNTVQDVVEAIYPMDIENNHMK